MLRRAEKSPVRSAAVGTVVVLGAGVEPLKPSKEYRKNSLSRPLNTLGIQTGPLNTPPYWFCRVANCFDPLENQLTGALIAENWLNSLTDPWKRFPPALVTRF